MTSFVGIQRHIDAGLVEGRDQDFNFCLKGTEKLLYKKIQLF